jgi:hypothetical protein
MAAQNVAERNGYACEPFAAAGWSHEQIEAAPNVAAQTIQQVMAAPRRPLS